MEKHHSLQSPEAKAERREIQRLYQAYRSQQAYIGALSERTENAHNIAWLTAKQGQVQSAHDAWQAASNAYEARTAHLRASA